ncbi:Gfo/Idh/MocA family oxidoreductase [Bradyrhizobium sp. 138]|uniref:Gfo/Idh/MocA family protein n=1 Tax=Bradyrhizobium sp. 138 TaxID=2782615 RepID=UPI001FF9954F
MSGPGVAIIGCGLIGHKRAKALGNARLVVCADIVQERADRLAATSQGCKAVIDWREAITDPSVSIVIIATLHDTLAEIAHGAVGVGKHILIEKPGARNAAELAGLAEAAATNGCLVRIGFNHRYHRALQKAQALVKSGELGPLMFLRARYGHGGRVGYDREWRSDPKKSGGGELIDQGPHLIDLARWFLGDFAEVNGFAATYYWKMPVDDNGFLLLKTAERKVAFLHASCTEWKNTFSLEIYGRHGKIDINGLGGSYGTERLTFYRMLPQMGPPETTSWEYPMEDNSWEVEFSEFIQDIRLKRQPGASVRDAIEALRIIEEIYRISGYDYDP